MASLFILYFLNSTGRSRATRPEFSRSDHSAKFS
nr:MAG TPA: hypothetical protein [Caudoviricetes sp.]